MAVQSVAWSAELLVEMKAEKWEPSKAARLAALKVEYWVALMAVGLVVLWAWHLAVE
jgi:hypothetical protein